MTPVATSSRERTLAYVAWVTVCIVWGTTYLGIRVALESVPVALLAGLRWTAAGTLLTAALPFVGERVPPVRAWAPIALSGFLLIGIGNGGVVWAEQYVPSGLTAVVIAIVPFWAVLAEAVLPRGERLTTRTLTGLAVGFLGIIVLVWPQLTIGGQEGRLFLVGVLALQLACIGWALGTAYTKRNAMAATPLAGSALQMLFSGVILTGIGAATGEFSRLAFTTRSASAMLYLVFIGSLVGYSAYLYALKYLPVSFVAQYAYVNPLIAVVLGTLVLGEPFSIRTLVAAALVFAGIAIVRSAPRPAKAPARCQATAV